MAANRIFLPRHEFINLAFPAVCLLILAAVFASGWRPSFEAISWMSLLTSTVLLGTLHVGMTLAGFFVLPEMKTWLRERVGAEDGARWALKHAFLLFGTFLFFLIVEERLFFASDYSHRVAFQLMFAGYFIGRCAHSIYQSMGLSLLYNQQAREQGLSKETTSALKRNERWERGMTHALLGTIFFQQGALLAVTTGLVPHEWMTEIRAIFVGASFLCAVGLFEIFRRGSDLTGASKAAFGLRYLFWPLAPLSPVALFMILAIHAVEYYCIFDKMMSRSSLHEEKRSTLSIFTPIFLVCLVVGILSLGNRVGIAGLLLGPTAAGAQDTLPFFIKIFIAARLAFAVSHFALDQDLFRMKDVRSRTLLGPLIAGSHHRENDANKSGGNLASA